MRLVAVVVAASLGIDQGIRAQNPNGKTPPGQMRSTTQAQRKAARARQAPQKKGVSKVFAGVNPATRTFSPLAAGLSTTAAMSAPLSTPDYFGVANWASSPLPTIDPLSGAITGGIRKFVNTLPGLCGVSPWGTAGANELGQCIPLATPFATPPAGVPADGQYYEIGLKDYSRQMHTDLPATKLRGYTDLNPLASSFGVNQYLGPLILARKGVPVRVKFSNNLGTGMAGNLFIPTDTTYMGAGKGPDGTAYTQNRATLHLHGGNTPWISDGTPHQWTVPNGELTNFKKGVSARDVPDMPATGVGSLTFYWTNQQGGRLMFYHDHAYGITRLNVYAGEAAGYLLVDPAQEDSLAAATVPGTIGATPDLGHLVPLVIQDKTFVPDDGVAGGQLAAQDPTWDVGNFGGKGSLWFPHVYMPNQNPYDPGGANAYGRWDYGPWFWPPQNPATLVSPPVPCTSVAYPGQPLTCPGTPNPSGVPEGFMDTPVVNGTVYPKLVLEPRAYRFQILNAGNDRALNLQLYVADPLSVAVTNGGTGYTSAPTVGFTGGGGGGAVATATISTGSVTDVMLTNGGTGYTSPVVTFTGGGGSGAAATAAVTSGVVTGIVVTSAGTGYTSAPTVTITDVTGTGATATATITPAGSVIGITVTNPGAGWTSAPVVTLTGGGGTGATAIASINMEVKMVDAVPHTAASPLPLCTTATAISAGAGLAIAAVNGGIPLNGTGLPGGCWPTTWPTDGRDGGVPDPATAGPPIIQIGTEGGLLPKSAVIPSTPMGYEYNRRSITVLNIFSHGLLLGPAERADVIVDFSAFAGKTLILYNDGPAPVPAFDPRSDYYTGDPDQSTTGGAPSTIPGYGPNTRTIMQIQVAGTPNTSFSLASLQSALPGIFATTQDSIIVPETAYPAGNGGAFTDAYARIQDTSMSFFNGPLTGLTLTNGGSGYTSAPAVGITGGGGSGATATATLGPRSVASLALGNGGSGYTSAPNVSITGGGGTGAAATATLGPRSVASIAVTNGGSGYTSVPTVTITGGGGSGATATATIRSNGQRNVTAITVTNGGSGYTSAPTVTITGGGGSGAAATPTLGPGAVASLALTRGGSGYTSAPTVSITGGGGTGAAATATLGPAFVASLTLTNGGTGYTSAPMVSITGGGGAGAAAFATAPVTPLLPKTIQELFTLDYGRMNATLGVELPFTNFLTQTTIPYGYVDPPTEIFKDGETQIWKITHNGVDTHFIHFHLFNVQVINRVGWDGAIKPPDPNELSWKDTVRMNPLEDIVVALRPLKQNLPWKLPNSIRPLDVTQPVGYASTMTFTNVDPTNQPATVTNDLTNFGWEYVWHCHILGHEENDMMRAMILAVPPDAPTNLLATVPTGKPAVTLTWTDNSLNETGFTIQRATNSAFTVGLTTFTVGPGTGTFTDTTVKKGTTYYYRVIANNVVGYTRAYAAPAVGYPHLSADSPAVISNSVTP
jgi:FtsP/CotA-like multicopper oxidase with cupredoxin domain